MKTKIFGTLLISVLSAGVAFAAPTAQIIGGVTHVQLSAEALQALDSQDITPSALSPGILQNGRVSFPIPGGAIDLGNSKGDILHTGGLAFDADDNNVSLFNFIISTTGQSPVLTGLAAVNDDISSRIPIFNLRLPQSIQPDDFGTIVIRDANLTLTQPAADALNKAFGVTAFQENFVFGTAVVVAQSLETSAEQDDTDDTDDTDDDENDTADEIQPE